MFGRVLGELARSREATHDTFPSSALYCLGNQASLAIGDSDIIVIASNGSVVKQEIIVGESNDNEVIVEHGLKEGDEFLFTTPNNAENLPLEPVDPKIKAEIKRKLAEEKARREAAAKEKAAKVEKYTPEQESGGGGFIIFN